MVDNLIFEKSDVFTFFSTHPRIQFIFTEADLFGAFVHRHSTVAHPYQNTKEMPPCANTQCYITIGSEVTTYFQ